VSAEGAGSPALILARGLGVPALAGAAAVLGFAPFYAWPVPLVSLAALFLVWRRSASPLQAALSGYAFGLGLNLAGVSWVFVSLHQFGSMPAPLAALATFLFCAFLAIFPAAAGWAARRMAPAGALAGTVSMAAWFLVAEWVRGWIFTGFPWLVVGYSQVPSSPLAGFAPVAGAYGVSLAATTVAACAAAALSSFAWSRERWTALAGLAALFGAGALLKLAPWTEPAGPPVTVSLLQGNVPQHLKWREDVRAVTLDDYARMVVASKARVIVLPETALPAFLDRLPSGYLEALAEHARLEGRDILLGTVERRFAGERFEYFNSVVTRGASPPQSYRKRHLVPFGEFIPPGFGFVLAVLKIPLTDFGRGDPNQPPLEAGGATWAVAICYEDIFGEELIDQLPRAGVLVNVSNDAWFGESLAADQHLQFSQMRALETGRWMVRATNTGVTAAIDERGRVVARLPAFVRATLEASPVPRSGSTPYVRWGNSLALALAALAIGLAAIRRARR
jgi:apolipoprotein N-acyltransferase